MNDKSTKIMILIAAAVETLVLIPLVIYSILSKR